MTNRKPDTLRNDNAVTDEQKAFDYLMMHYNRVVTMDEISDKAINRAGKVGDAIRDLLGAVNLYRAVRSGAKVMRLENESHAKSR